MANRPGNGEAGPSRSAPAAITNTPMYSITALVIRPGEILDATIASNAPAPNSKARVKVEKYA